MTVKEESNWPWQIKQGMSESVGNISVTCFNKLVS